MRIGKEESRLYTKAGLKGLDLRHTATQEHSSYMENLLCVDGALRKRRGIKDLFSIEDENGCALPINGIYDLLGTVIVHAGNSLYDCGQAPLSKRIPTYTPRKINSDVLLESKPLDGCVHNGTLWLVSNAELVCFDGKSLYPLGEGAYIPTTRRGIKSIQRGAGYKEAEAENLLSAKRRNYFSGTKSDRASFELDSELDGSKGFSMLCQMDISLSDTDTQAHYIGFTEPKRLTIERVEGVVGGATNEEVAKILDGTGTSYGFDALSEVNIFLKEPCYISSFVLNAQVGRGVPRIRLSLGASTIYEDSELSGKERLDITSQVNGKTIDCITLYGNDALARIKTIECLARDSYEGEIELLFNESTAEKGKVYYPKRISTPQGQELTLYTSVSANATKGAYIFFSSGLNGTVLNLAFEAPAYIENRDNIKLTYSKKNAEIPKISLAKECKSDTGEQILALCLKENGLCFTSKEKGFSYVPSSHYTVLGNTREITALCQMENYGVGVFKEDECFISSIGSEGVKYSGSMQSCGCVNNRCVVTVGSDTLTLCKNGVFGTKRDASARVRSSAINSLLMEQDLTGAFCLQEHGRVYIFLKDYTLVCDTTQKAVSAHENDFEYEWFLLKGPFASCGSVIGNEMYLGTQNGKIRTLYEGFYDISHRKLLDGELVILENNEKTELCLSQDIKISDGCEIELENAGIVLLNDFLQLETEYGAGFMLDYEKTLYEDGTARLFTGMEIFALVNDEIYLGEIAEIDEQNGIILTTLPCENEYSVVFKDTQGVKITLKKSGENYKMLENGSEIVLTEYEKARALLVERTPVVAKYESARLCLGDTVASKSLHRIILDLLPCTNGEIIVGYETNKGSANDSTIIGRALDFNALDLGTLSLGRAVQKGCVIRCFERGFSYIIIKITSNAPYDFALNGFSLAYTQNGLLSYDRG